MRKVLPVLLAGLGAFLVAMAIVALTWVPGVVERTPLDTDNTTELSGTVSVLGEAEGPAKAWSVNKVDSNASDDDVAVFDTSLCLVHDEDDIDGCVDGEDSRLISAETTRFATDRHTAETVDNEGYLSEDNKQMEGLQNKWPFNAEKKAYPVWDDLVDAAVDATFEGEEEIDGLKVYVYSYSANVGPVVIVGDIIGTYFGQYTFYVEPKTGSIINQTIHQERLSAGVESVLDLDLEFTDEQIQANVDDANEALSLLNLMEVIIPIVGFAVGIPALVIGLLLMLRGRRKRQGDAAEPAPKETAGV
jgi:hypothetical protein